MTASRRPARATFVYRRLLVGTVAACLLAGLVLVAGETLPQVHIPVADSPRPVAAARGKPAAHHVPVVTQTASPSPSPLVPVAAVTQTVVVGATTRSYQVWAPPVAAGTRLPTLIVLSGTDASLDLEEGRDGLLPLASQGRAIVVYPHDYKLSWNAGACCGGAEAAGVDDLGYMAALVHALAARADTGPISLIGYSNGGRLVYDVACSNPTLAAAYVVVAASRVAACRTTTPVSLLVLAGSADPEVQYNATNPAHSSAGFREASVVDEISYWRRRDGCAAAAASESVGSLVLQTWSGCSASARVILGTYQGLDHAWPPGTATTPSAASVLWAFLQGTPPSVGQV